MFQPVLLSGLPTRPLKPARPPDFNGMFPVWTMPSVTQSEATDSARTKSYQGTIIKLKPNSNGKAV